MELFPNEMRTLLLAGILLQEDARPREAADGGLQDVGHDPVHPPRPVRGVGSSGSGQSVVGDPARMRQRREDQPQPHAPPQHELETGMSAAELAPVPTWTGAANSETSRRDTAPHVGQCASAPSLIGRSFSNADLHVGQAYSYSGTTHLLDPAILRRAPDSGNGLRGTLRPRAPADHGQRDQCRGESE